MCVRLFTAHAWPSTSEQKRGAIEGGVHHLLKIAKGTGTSLTIAYS